MESCGSCNNATSELYQHWDMSAKRPTHPETPMCLSCLKSKQVEVLGVTHRLCRICNKTFQFYVEKGQVVPRNLDTDSRSLFGRSPLSLAKPVSPISKSPGHFSSHRQEDAAFNESPIPLEAEAINLNADDESDQGFSPFKNLMQRYTTDLTPSPCTVGAPRTPDQPLVIAHEGPMKKLLLMNLTGNVEGNNGFQYFKHMTSKGDSFFPSMFP